MVLYFCLIPNRGARIGHQTDDHFNCVAYCNKNNFIFVYHPFIGNSSIFENELKFNTLYENNYDNILKKVDRIIDINKLNQLKDEKKTIHETLLDIHNSQENILLIDHICGNENFYLNYNIIKNDIIEIKKTYRNILLPHYPKYFENPYICIHFRCGDIINDESRYLNIDYFIDKYYYLIQQFPEIKDLPIYLITEYNFKDECYLHNKIPNCKIIKSDEVSSFYYLVNCNYLIASRSGFSNLAYILGNMKVIKAPNDWNAYWDNLIL
jgi:hypothetical protein